MWHTHSFWEGTLTVYDWWKIGRETSTDRLANVIQVIELGRKTGVLTVERNTGLSVEEGMIYFVRGHITHASGGQRVGLDALNWLNSWGACRFTFVSRTSSRNTGPHTPIPESFAGNRVKDTDPALRIQKPITGQSDNFLATPLGMRQETHIEPFMTLSPAPYRTRQLQEALLFIERMGFSRAHRRLFLLIDGQRLAAELARLMGRSESEVDELLQDLERSGLIGK